MLYRSRILIFWSWFSHHINIHPLFTTKMIPFAVWTGILSACDSSWYSSKSFWSGVKCIEAPESRIHNFLLAILWSHAHFLWSDEWWHKQSILSMVDVTVWVQLSTGISHNMYELWTAQALKYASSEEREHDRLGAWEESTCLNNLDQARSGSSPAASMISSLTPLDP